jgi:SAM-dependent methyltransferase
MARLDIKESRNLIMGSDEADKLERERREADAGYNDALTALDRAIVSLGDREVTHHDVARIGTTLLGFLQQITAFVETKERKLAADARARVEALAPALAATDELRTQIAVLRRAVESLMHRASAVGDRAPATATALAEPSPAPIVTSADYRYVAFEDEFRGSIDAIEERLRAYVPIFAGRTHVLDIGCGRGELLAALLDAGIPARGIDASAAMVDASRERGLDATPADALAYVAQLPEASLGGIVATQVIEHLEPNYLMRLIDAAARALRPKSPIVLETINPACWLAFFSSYLRDLTHVRPVHPETLQFLLRASGFERVEIQYRAPVPSHVKMKSIDLPADVLASADLTSGALASMAHTINANAAILNNLMFTHLDYAAVGYRS